MNDLVGALRILEAKADRLRRIMNWHDSSAPRSDEMQYKQDLGSLSEGYQDIVEEVKLHVAENFATIRDRAIRKGIDEYESALEVVDMAVRAVNQVLVRPTV